MIFLYNHLKPFSVLRGEPTAFKVAAFDDVGAPQTASYRPPAEPRSRVSSMTYSTVSKQRHLG